MTTLIPEQDATLRIATIKVRTRAGGQPFAEHARTDVRWLLAEHARLTRENAALQSDLEQTVLRLAAWEGTV